MASVIVPLGAASTVVAPTSVPSFSTPRPPATMPWLCAGVLTNHSCIVSSSAAVNAVSAYGGAIARSAAGSVSQDAVGADDALDDDDSVGRNEVVEVPAQADARTAARKANLLTCEPARAAIAV